MANKEKKLTTLDIEILRSVVAPDLTEDEYRLIIAYAEKYSLDPLLKHLVVMKRKMKDGSIRRGIYITRDGLLHVAHESGQFDGMKAWVDEGEKFAYSIVHRKDMAHPFEYQIKIEEYDAKEYTWKSHRTSMAIKVAEVFGLRRAFDVAITPAEEMEAVAELVNSPTAEKTGEQIPPEEKAPKSPGDEFIEVTQPPALKEKPAPKPEPEPFVKGGSMFPPAEKPAPKPEPEGEMKLVTEITGVKWRPSGKGGKFYTIETSDGRKAGTFSEALALLAKQLKIDKADVVLVTTPSKDGKYLDLVDVAGVAEK